MHLVIRSLSLNYEVHEDRDQVVIACILEALLYSHYMPEPMLRGQRYWV